MRLFLIEPNAVLIKDMAGNSVSFSNIAELRKYSGVDLTYTNLNQVSYAPDSRTHVWFDGVDTHVKICPDSTFDSLINRVAELKSKKEDPYFGLSDAEKKDVAFRRVLSNLEEVKRTLNNISPFLCNNIKYVNDETNIQGVKVQILDKSRNDPIPTLLGTPNAGCWRTYDNQFVPFTNGEFIDQLCEAYFTMRSHNFTNHGLLEYALNALYANETSTFQDIENFNIFVGWSPISVV